MQIKRNQTKAGIILFLVMMVFASCKDEYEYDNKEPDFLGNSIYEYLEEDGGFTCFVRLIDDLGYKEVLSKTGSKTLFAVRDDAFQRFLANNSYGVNSYEKLSYAQKRQILNASLLNMAYLSYMLANATESESLGEGAALRRDVSYTYLDSISYIQDPVLFANPFWSQFQGKGLYLIDNEGTASMIHFNQTNMTTHRISNEDFSVIHNGTAFQPGATYVNGIKIKEQDIVCKNGYIHVMEELLTPLKNMSQTIRDNGQTTLFNRLLNRFCVPYYSENLSRSAHQYYDGSSPERPLIPASDSVFVKRYLTTDFNTDANGNSMSDYGLLHFDPSDNHYGSQREMGVMFIPTDQAMEAYINGERGEYLKNVYGTWENVPTSILALFLKNHQKKNFTSALPHAWPTMNDESSYPMYVDAKHIVHSYLTTNGVVYITSEVYPPVDYQSVFASVMTTTASRIMNWAIRDEGMKFLYYLRSMENMYNLLVPTDEALQNYRDPITWAIGGTARRIWSFRYVPATNRVVADLYAVDAEGNKTGNVLSTITDQAIVKNRLKDILDMHIVVGEKSGDAMWGYLNEGGILYALTKGGATIQVEGTGGNMTVTGGGDLERQVAPAEIITNTVTGKKDIYDSRNGRTYFIDKVVQDPVKSLYTVLGEHPEYEAFFNLLKGDDRVFNLFTKDKDVVPVFDRKIVGTTSGLGGFVVNSFNNFRYTVFVPTESALAAAFAANDSLFTWDEIAADEDLDRKKVKTQYLLKFLKYHFMDNAVFIDGNPSGSPLTYETAARNPSEKFYKLIVEGNGSDLQVMNENQTIRANVIRQAGIYNVMARDCIVNSASYANATQIISSSRSVVHLIDKALDFDK